VTGPTDDERRYFKRADAVFDALLDLPRNEWQAHLEVACGGDAQLNQHVSRLISAHNAAGRFMDDPAGVVAFPLLFASSIDRTGHTIARYRIVRQLGRGGMASVWLARDQHLERDVALKIVDAIASERHDSSTIDAADSTAMHEAQLVARLDHPNVAGIYDVGRTDDGALWFAMPYCAGGSLADLLARGPVAAEHMFRIVRELSSALAATHALGIAHRDVKPGNVLFDVSGRVRLADFGIAQEISRGWINRAEIVGTVAYLSPEQIRGRDVDHTTDLWSLGVTLYEMLAGRRPFEGANSEHIMRAIVEEQPAPIPGAPAELMQVTLQLLSKNPADRPSANDLLLALDKPARLSLSRRIFRARTVVPAVTIVSLSIILLAFNGEGTSVLEDETSRIVSARSVEVNDLVIKARHFRQRRTEEGLELAVDAFKEAIAVDSAAAEAWAGLANTYVMQVIFSHGRPDSLIASARLAAQHALQLDSTAAEAHTAMGHLQRIYDFDWRASLQSTSLAIKHSPQNEFPRLLHALTLIDLRRFDEAEQMLEQARALNTVDYTIVFALGRVYLYTGRLSESRDMLLSAIQLYPYFSYAHQQLGYVELQRGEPEAALRAFRRAAELSGVRDSAHLAYGLAVTGHTEDARSIVAALERSESERYLPPLGIAAAYSGLGDKDNAFRWLERAWEERAAGLDAASVYPCFVSLYTDPRWTALMRRVGVL
jgi:serine/threonine protein kinase